MNADSRDPQAPRELDFADDDQGQALGQAPVDPVEQPPRGAVNEPGLTGGATLTPSEHEDNVSQDDLSPDTLLDESGARSPLEPGGDGPLDEQLREVDESEIGGGTGLDEEELARTRPLDGSRESGKGRRGHE